MIIVQNMLGKVRLIICYFKLYFQNMPFMFNFKISDSLVNIKFIKAWNFSKTYNNGIYSFYLIIMCIKCKYNTILIIITHFSC